MYRIQNIGQAPARDIRAQIRIGKNDPLDIRGPDVLRQLEIAEREGFVLPLSRPLLGGAGAPVPPDYPDSDVISITLFFSDFRHDLGMQQTEPFCFRFVRAPEGAKWLSRAEPCEQPRGGRISRNQEARPRNLTADEHTMLEVLVRRAATKSHIFQPTILTHRMGDDKQLYASQLVPGAQPDIEDRPNFEHYRDFTPTLIQQGLLIPVTRDELMMDESLFRAYGFEPPT
jgi:hypothetical protein